MNKTEILKELNEIKQQNKQILTLLNLLIGSNKELNKVNMDSKWITTDSSKTKEEFIHDYMETIISLSINQSLLNRLTNEH